MTRTRQIKVWLLGAVGAGIALVLFMGRDRYHGDLVGASHRILKRVQTPCPNSSLSTSDAAPPEERRTGPLPVDRSDEVMARDIEDEIARRMEESSVLQRQIRENEIHIGLLLGRGYSNDSTAVTLRRKENEKYHAQVKERGDVVRDLRRRLQRVRSVLAIQGTDASRSYDPQMDRAWYFWEQTHGGKDDDLLEIGGDHGFGSHDVNHPASVAIPRTRLETDRIIPVLSEAARQLLAQDHVVCDAQVPGLSLAQYFRLPSDDRRIIEQALGMAQAAQREDTSPYVELVASPDGNTPPEHLSRDVD